MMATDYQTFGLDPNECRIINTALESFAATLEHLQAIAGVTYADSLGFKLSEVKLVQSRFAEFGKHPAEHTHAYGGTDLTPYNEVVLPSLWNVHRGEGYLILGDDTEYMIRNGSGRRHFAHGGHTASIELTRSMGFWACRLSVDVDGSKSLIFRTEHRHHTIGDAIKATMDEVCKDNTVKVTFIATA